MRAGGAGKTPPCSNHLLPQKNKTHGREVESLSSSFPYRIHLLPFYLAQYGTISYIFPRFHSTNSFIAPSKPFDIGQRCPAIIMHKNTSQYPGFWAGGFFFLDRIEI